MIEMLIILGTLVIENIANIYIVFGILSCLSNWLENYKIIYAYKYGVVCYCESWKNLLYVDPIFLTIFPKIAYFFVQNYYCHCNQNQVKKFP